LYGLTEEVWQAYCGIVGGKTEADNKLKTRVLPEALDPLAKLLYVTLKVAIEFIETNKPKEYKDLPFLTDLIKELTKNQSVQVPVADKEHQTKIDKLLAKRRIDVIENEEDDKENIQ